MTKQTLYPKTQRLGKEKIKVIITEKLDGSNLGLFKLNGELIVAQRNNVFNLGVNPNKSAKDSGITYKGLIGYLEKYGDKILESLYEGSGVFGEWLGMGHIKYEGFPKFNIFAKARIHYDLEYSISNLNFDLNQVKYAFGGEIPKGIDIGLVPVVTTMELIPSVSYLDTIYDEYSTSQNRTIEGFIINIAGKIQKYVRYKRGKLTKHKIQ